MTQTIMVANRNGTVQTPDGQLFRLRAGLTYADPDHIAVTSYPQDWRTLTVELAAPRAVSDPERDGSVLDDLREELAVTEEAADAYRKSLESIVSALDGAGLLVGVDRTRDGWLADRIAELLQSWPPAMPPEVAERPDVAPYLPPDRAESKAIREWASANNITVSDRGVLSRVLVENYRSRADG